MANTYIEYTGDNSTTNYTFPFEYFEQSEVKATIDGTATTDFTFANATTLSFNTAPGTGAKIRIYRETDVTTLKATFFPGSAIKAEDLNDNFTQNNFAVEEIRESTWDVDTETIKSNETWVSSDSQIATTAAMDARFQDEVNDTYTKAELAAGGNIMPNNDDAVPTTGAVNDYINEVITNDIGTDGTGITVTDDGDGTITLGLADNTIDFSKLKDEDIITYAEQNAGSPSWNSDSRLATTYAASRRFDLLVQSATPSGSDWVTGKTWLQNDQDLTLSIWDGTNWLAIASGGAFTNQPKVIYVDATSGADSNDGHRISRPKRTIKAAVNAINADSTYGDGSVVVVAPGVYQEAAPIDITKKDVSIIGTALRSCVVHPTPATEENSLFRVNSGSFLQNLTFTGVKASGTRGGYSLDSDSTYGLPANQGWNVSFYPNATIVKSPYIQNCTNFSDSEIDNSDLSAHNPAGGSAGDTDSQPTGGGLLIDGAAVNSNSPLRSMVCDSYTHVGLDGPGVLVTNNGYCQATSSYAFFNHYHIKCLNGGQANLAASTTDFGRYGLVVDGRSTNAIFGANTTANAADGDTTFTIGTPSAGSNWHGSATRPQGNMLVDIGGNTYPVLSATANGSGWDVTISRPDPSKRDRNLGLDGAVSSGAAVSFFLRSMIASSGHTMEYVGSGTNYSALPENGGVPIEANQVVELNNGKVWTATTDHNGKFKVGDFFTVDQRTGFVTVPEGSISFPKLAEDLVVNGHEITSESNGNVVINPDGTGIIELGSNVGIGTASPGGNLHVQGVAGASGTFYLTDGDTTGVGNSFLIGKSGTTTTIKDRQSGSKLDFGTSDTIRMSIDSNGKVGIGTSSPGVTLEVSNSTPYLRLRDSDGTNKYTDISNANGSTYIDSRNGDNNGNTIFRGISAGAAVSEYLRITSTGNVGIGTASPAKPLHVNSGVDEILRLETADNQLGNMYHAYHDATGELARVGMFNSLNDLRINNLQSDGVVTLRTADTDRLRIDSSGLVGIDNNSPQGNLHVGSAIGYLDSGRNTIFANSGSHQRVVIAGDSSSVKDIQFRDTSDTANKGIVRYDGNDHMRFYTNGTEQLRINSSGNVGIGTASPLDPLHVLGPDGSGGSPSLSSNNIALFQNDGAVGDGAIISVVAGTSGIAQLSLGDVDNANIGAIKYDNSADLLEFTTNGIDQVAITSAGNVGIGTTSPGDLLHIQSSSPVIRGVDSDNNALAKVNFGSGNITLDADSSNTSASSIINFKIDGDEKARIDSSGNVGIGTSGFTNLGAVNAPALGLYASGGARLGIFGNGGRWWYANAETSNAFTIGFRSSSNTVDNTVITALTSGNVGIGTSSPQAKLDIRTSAGTACQIFLNEATTANALKIEQTSTEARIQTTATQPLVIAGQDGPGSTSDIRFETNSTERLRIDSAGRLLVGTTNGGIIYGGDSNNALQVRDGASSKIVVHRQTDDVNAAYLRLAKGRLTSPGTVQNNDEIGRIEFIGHDGTDLASRLGQISCYVDGTPGSNDTPGRLVFSTTADGASSPTERMRISSDGEVLFGVSSNRANANSGLGGHAIGEPGNAAVFARQSSLSIIVNRITDDGGLIQFKQNGTVEGSISVSGTTVSYNGAHLSRWSQLPSGAERTEILRGTVLSNIDEMCEWGEEDNEQLNRMKVSDVEGDKNVSGVFQAWDDDDDTYINDFYCAMTGDFVIRIAAGVSVERGDLLMSAGDGTAKPQDDDIIRSKTIAKITSTNVSETYADGSYCVPCVLMAC